MRSPKKVWCALERAVCIPTRALGGDVVSRARCLWLRITDSLLVCVWERYMHTRSFFRSLCLVYTHARTLTNTHTFPVLQYETRYRYKSSMQPQIAYIAYAHVVCCRALQQSSATHHSIYSIRSCAIWPYPQIAYTSTATHVNTCKHM